MFCPKLLLLFPHLSVDNANSLIVRNTGLSLGDRFFSKQQVKHTAVRPEKSFSVDDPRAFLADFFQHEEEKRLVSSAVETLSCPNTGLVFSGQVMQRNSNHRRGSSRNQRVGRESNVFYWTWKIPHSADKTGGEGSDSVGHKQSNRSQRRVCEQRLGKSSFLEGLRQLFLILFIVLIGSVPGKLQQNKPVHGKDYGTAETSQEVEPMRLGLVDKLGLLFVLQNSNHSAKRQVWAHPRHARPRQERRNIFLGQRELRHPILHCVCVGSFSRDMSFQMFPLTLRRQVLFRINVLRQVGVEAGSEPERRHPGRENLGTHRFS
ncbi:hypothetical protein CLUG_03382 [Clavispora lusitaniae ATCC 42720]|uniref:Uncharacterized protein n=1 Tax=Clavispora lusitaniae (strain ATCC 42720) TaxID=306902 RepID=C4Y5E8_CLAL4|nr:uncharacterized protein CLUG_03382 [Clavispora lusitaniae ATCC 42720]EEQ39254.1 hypothetical protein CLUG_03382 [Clavispora lusitaniae ATCC 42720]